MRTITYFGLVLFLIGLAESHALAKREAPEDVPPVKLNGVIYEVPHMKFQIQKFDPACKQHGGYVVAKDEKTEKVLWFAKIYTVKYDRNLETDVQDCFINTLKVDGNKLIITNESGGKFELDPATKAVKVLQGAAVIKRANEVNAD